MNLFSKWATIVFLVLVPFLAEANSFTQLECSSTISSDLSVSSVGTDLHYKLEARGQEIRPLLRAILPDQFPDSLVRAYHCITLEFSLPLSACTFSAESPELFKCKYARNNSAPINISVVGKLSCYEDEADTYLAKVSKIELESKIVERKSRNGEVRNYFMLKNKLAVLPENRLVDVNSEEYIAYPWEYDGFDQDPECAVDGAPINP